MIKGGVEFKGMGSFASPLHTNCRIYAISGQDLAEASANNIPMEFPILQAADVKHEWRDDKIRLNMTLWVDCLNDG